MNSSRSRFSSDSFVGLALAAPAMFVFSFIVLYPFLNSILMSFTDRSLLRPTAEFVGLENYVTLFTDPSFPAVLGNTFVFVLFSTLAPFLAGLVWALVLNQAFRGSHLVRGITLVCWIIPSTAIGFLWMWIFHGHYGILNEFLLSLGIIQEKITWLGRPGSAMAGVVTARTWQLLPWNMAFILGALQSVPKDTVEAARLDGAGNGKVFLHVVLPSIRDVLVVVLLLGTIGSLQHFDLLWVMTEGGPARATTTLSIETYNRAFVSFRLGLAATVGTVWVLILGTFGFFYLRRRA